MASQGDKSAAPPQRRGLLLAGVAAGVVFCASVALQMLTRDGFDPVRHPLSLLSLGKEGWHQRATFVLSGALVISGALGSAPLSRNRKGQLSRVLIGIFGLGSCMAGIFVPDPAFGFPPGTPSGPPTTSSLHNTLHGACFNVAFLGGIVAAFLVSSSQRRVRPRLATVSKFVGILLPILVVGGMGLPNAMGLFFFAAGAIGFLWTSYLSFSFLNDPAATPAQPRRLI